MPLLVTDESIAGSTTTSSISCPATAYLLPPTRRPASDGRPPARWPARPRRLACPARSSVPPPSTSGASPSRVEHVRLTLSFNGAQQGTNPTDYWVVPSTGLIVREKEQVAVTSGGVRYNESMETALTSLQPAS